MVKAWKETVTIPTYEVGAPEKNPIFLEKRVYQGSSGAVYPYPVIESIANEKYDKQYDAVFLENEYLKIMVLPELGGRIQMAFDKIANRHFIYYNQVIKPALVGLAGPWISGGIEFNWPQHHRPSTYMPVDCKIENNADGSVTVWVNEMERMTHQKGMAGFTLRPGHAYLEIKGRVSNRTDIPQTFLWWANPAVTVNDHYQSVFPPDINAVFDHGKRAVSTFPIATGTYYKMDYSAGVDISNYKNIKVPTSYMGVNSRFDFEGGYENDTRAGMLHVASHHFSPGKKQWTWGNGDFGRAWDRNLTDEDGPYIELMAGVFTENQPDFSWLMPGEEKSFTQYFMPYREIGIVKNANKDILLNVEPSEEGKAVVRLYATSRLSGVLKVYDVNSAAPFAVEPIDISPEKVVEIPVDVSGIPLENMKVEITVDDRVVLEWHNEEDDLRTIPDAAEAALAPSEIKTNEQLYLTGLHLEQYRHATFNPVDYYEEALRRDPDDIRCNNAMGLWLIRKCRFDKAEPYLRNAVRQLKRRNPNPYDGEPIYNLALALKYQGKLSEAYDNFLKATWNGAWQESGFFEAAKISGREGRWEDSLYEVERALIRNSHNHQALALKAAIQHRLGKDDDALKTVEESLKIDPFNFGALLVKYLFLKSICVPDSVAEEKLISLMHGNPHNFDEVALDFANAGLYEEALALWRLAEGNDAVTPMTYFYEGWTRHLSGDAEGARRCFEAGAAMSPDLCFPNRPEAVLALNCAIDDYGAKGYPHQYLGNLYYDKRQYDLARRHWELAVAEVPDYPTAHRNLALLYFNKCNQPEKALQEMEKAFSLDLYDSRVLMELDQLYKRLQRPHEERLAFLQLYPDLIAERDDLVLEEITLLNQTDQYADAKELLDEHVFHPWEGGEGKVPVQYQFARVESAKVALSIGDPLEAVALLEECLEYPPHLGEGKLHGAQENDFHYLLGVAWRELGDKEKADMYFQLATQGNMEPAPALYYNDAKPDKIFYAGMAYRALGEDDKANAVFNRLVNYGRTHIHDKVTMDYFAVSLPDLLIWEDDLDVRNRVHCLFMMALGYAGLGDMKRYEKYFNEAFALDVNHQGLASIQSLVNILL